MRIVEPFVKGHLALWLVTKGAESVTVSVDGAEPSPEAIQNVLISAAYTHVPAVRSVARWTGRYFSGRSEITVVSLPGLDLEALFPDGRRCVAECKGEPTPKGMKSGTDLTGFYTALGQLIMTLGALSPIPDWRVLAIPARPRFAEIARKAENNQLLRSIGVSLILVDEDGNVTGDLN